MNWKDLFGWLLPKKPDKVAKYATPAESVERRVPSTQETPRKKTPDTERGTGKKLDQKQEKIEGWQTQFNGISRDAKGTEVVIGLDFGTAFTKVVISTQGQKYGVPLNDNGHGTDKYLLATRLFEDAYGGLTVTPPEKCRRHHVGFKMKILDGTLDSKTRDRIIVYLAWVLRKSRRWLMTEKRTIFGDVQLMWELNVGLPTEKLKDHTLKKIYQELIGEAWYRSTELQFENEGGNDKMIDDAGRRLHPDMINAFPEFVAQVQVYLSSPQRQDGVHTMVDVGAGTVDATVFIVHWDKLENKYPILASSVARLGTIHLANACCEGLNASSNWRPVPHELFPTRREFAEKIDVTEANIEQTECKIRRPIINLVHDVFERSKEKRMSVSVMPLMLCGGGARIEFYRDVVDVLTLPHFGYPFRKSTLPELTDVLDAPDLQGNDGDRLSVAYGLTFDLGIITNPDPIEEKKINKRTKCTACNGIGGLHRDCDKCGGSGFV